jgi:LacI family transcriptional regulator
MATIRDVAALAGVSTTTVSYALNRPDRVTDEMRLRVQEAVRSLNYRPDGAARALRTGRSHLVSLIVPDVANHFYAAMARGVADTVKPRGLHVVVGSTDAEAAEEIYFLEESVLQRAAGIIVVPFRLTADTVQSVAGRDMPIVLVSGEIGAVEMASIYHNDIGGIEQAVQHLLQQGRRRIAFIGGLANTPVSARRYSGYMVAHRQFGVSVDPRLHVTADFKRAGGEQAMQSLLVNGVAFDAVSAANDLMAIGAMRVLRRHGLRIPQDVAVVGYDDIDEAEIVDPALTTVRQPAYEMGQLAATLLLQHIDGDPQTHTHIAIPTTLVVRDSA